MSLQKPRALFLVRCAPALLFALHVGCAPGPAQRARSTVARPDGETAGGPRMRVVDGQLRERNLTRTSDELGALQHVEVTPVVDRPLSARRP